MQHNEPYSTVMCWLQTWKKMVTYRLSSFTYFALHFSSPLFLAFDLLNSLIRFFFLSLGKLINIDLMKQLSGRRTIFNEIFVQIFNNYKYFVDNEYFFGKIFIVVLDIKNFFIMSILINFPERQQRKSHQRIQKIGSKKERRREMESEVYERREIAYSNERDDIWPFSSMFVANTRMLNKAHLRQMIIC